MPTERYVATGNVWANSQGNLAPGGTPIPPVGEWPGGLYTPTRTLWGAAMGLPSGTNTDTELDEYRLSSKPVLWDYISDEYADLVGDVHSNVNPFFQLVRVYDGGFPTNVGGTEGSNYLSRGVSLALSVKGNDNTMISGGYNSQIQSMVNSLPTDKVSYLMWNHERDNDDDFIANPTSVSAIWRQACAKWAERIIFYRGTTRPVVPGSCVTGWNMRTANSSFNHNLLNMASELTALGVDLDEFIFTSDPYHRSTTATTTWPAADLKDIADRQRGWGFQRVGFSEVGVKTEPAAHRTAALTAIRSLGALAKQEKWEFVLWYMSGGGAQAGTDGWWIYGDANKTAYALNSNGDYPP